MENNVCKFVQTKNVMQNINIINFVYEKEADFKQSFIIPACHSLYLVTQGNGILHTTRGDFKIGDGDMFLTFSSKPFYIENSGDLQYIYISFLGLRASGLFERLKISYTSPVYSGYSFLKERWIEDFENSNENNIDLICEALLLRSLSFLCKSSVEVASRAGENSILSLKLYADMHYTEAELNLQNISKKFNYSPKYVSSAFKKLVKIPFSSYLCNLRLNHAKTLLKSGMSNIQEIALSSGFSDAGYFSKTFKKHFGMTPKEAVIAAREEKNK